MSEVVYRLDQNDVTAASLGDDGILAGMRPGSIWISIVLPVENTNRIKELVEE